MTEGPGAYVVTHHWVPNFGANLQALGTLQALQERGVSTRFADFRPQELVAKYGGSVPTSQLEAHEAFVQEHLPLTRRITGQAEFEALCREAPADIYVTGSDAVFRVSPGSTRADLVFPNPYWLCGVTGRENRSPLKIALAPSAMGSRFADLHESGRREMQSALEDISYLSARDSWTRDQIASVGVTRGIPLIPDPVFLLGDTIGKERAAGRSGRPYIVVCTQRRRSGRWMERFTRIAEAAGYDTVALPTPEGVVDAAATHTEELPITPLRWLRLLAGSAGYVGVRFHPVVVSLIAEIPVVALDLYHAHPLSPGKSKTWLLLRDFGLSRVCHGRRMHAFLSPGHVWRQLESQRETIDGRARLVAQSVHTINAYLDDAVGALFP